MDTQESFFRADYTGFRRCPETRWEVRGHGSEYMAPESRWQAVIQHPQEGEGQSEDTEISKWRHPGRKSPGRALCRERSLATEPFPLADNQSEYSVGSEEEDEDFDERPEGSICFLTFYYYSPHCP